jgi:hypothetical protein
MPPFVSACMWNQEEGRSKSFDFAVHRVVNKRLSVRTIKSDSIATRGKSGKPTITQSILLLAWALK